MSILDAGGARHSWSACDRNRQGACGMVRALPLLPGVIYGAAYAKVTR